MGSITQDEYSELKQELEDRFLEIILLNKYTLLDFLNSSRTDLYFTSAIVPKHYSNDFLFISKSSTVLPISGDPIYNNSCEFSDEKIHFLFGHYILKELSQNELRELLVSAFKNKIANAIKPLQRKWREYYYKPDGPFILNNLEKICNRNGFKP